MRQWLIEPGDQLPEGAWAGVDLLGSTMARRPATMHPHHMNQRDDLEEIWKARERTLQLGTARILLEGEYPADLDDDSGRLRSGGEIDLQNLRYHLGGEYETVADGGRRFSREEEGSARWVVSGEPAGLPGPESPFWLLDLVLGASDVRGSNREGTGTSAVMRYSCRCDLVQADDRSPRGITVPGGHPLRMLRGIDLEVCIDDDGRLRRVACAFAGYAMSLELWDFDGPAPVDLPPEDSWIRWTDLELD